MDKIELNFEELFGTALAEIIDHCGGCIENALDELGVYEDEKQEAIKEWFGWEDEDSDEPDFDRRKIEEDYNLEEGELDGIYNLREVERIIGAEDGELDRYLWDEDYECYFYQQEDD